MGASTTLRTTERFARLVIYLQEHRYGGTIAELAEELEIKKRTLYRYLDLMERIGLKLRVERLPHSRGVGPARFRLADRMTWAQGLVAREV